MELVPGTQYKGKGRPAQAALGRWQILGNHALALIEPAPHINKNKNGYLKLPNQPARPSPRGPENSVTAKPANHKVAGFD